ncbi:MAG: hypothetical protein WCP39_01840 [Chlamydiota bacterium]
MFGCRIFGYSQPAVETEKELKLLHILKVQNWVSKVKIIVQLASSCFILFGVITTSPLCFWVGATVLVVPLILLTIADSVLLHKSLHALD